MLNAMMGYVKTLGFRVGSPAALAIAGTCGTLVFWRAFHGPYTSPLAVRSPMNLEGIFALALLLLAFLRARSAEQAKEFQGSVALRGSRSSFWALGIAALVFAAFLPFLNFPFLADDYEHIWNARNITPSTALAHFTKPETDRFFRPLVYLFYAGEASFAGLSPAIWRAVSVTWHLAASILVWRLLLRLTSNGFAAFAGAALFAIHGARPEAVTWVAALFDLMAATFGLAGLLLLLEKRQIAASVALFMALLCKESAFVFPLLAILLLRFQGLGWRSCASRCAAWFAIAGVVFAYRWHLLGEIGGYHNSGDGRPTIFNLRLTTTLKGFFVRSWAALFVPLNWSHAPGMLLAILLLAALAGLLWLAWQGGDGQLLTLGLLFLCIAALPVHQFLSIGDDLEKSRVLYLPSAGLAILFAGLANRNRSKIAVAAVLLFQFAALRHNLEIWKQVGYLAASACNAAPESGGPAMENVVDGVYFLKTGYPQCKWINESAHTPRN